MSEYKELEYVFGYMNCQVYKTVDFDSLPEITKQKLEPQLVEAAASGFKRPLTEAFKDDVASHIRGGDLYIITKGVVQGFAMLQPFLEQDAVYIAGVVKKPGTSYSGIVEDIVLSYLASNRVEIGVVRTQNDRVADIMSNRFGTVVAIDQQAGSREVELLRKMNLLSPDLPFDENNLIVKGYYGGPMIVGGERRRSKDSRITNLTDKLDYYAGDAMLLVGYGIRTGGGGF